MATNATINGNNHKQSQQVANDVDDKLRRFNIHQLRTLAKHKSISTSINKDPMIEKIKSVYKFRNVHEITDTLNSLNSTQRPYQYAFLDPDTNPLMIELRKINIKIDNIVDRMNAIEQSQKEIRDVLSLICNQSQSRQVTISHNLAARNTDYHN